KRLHRRLKQLGYKGPFKLIQMSSWKNARSPLASYAMPNQWFNVSVHQAPIDRKSVTLST
ncbi:hypothetical protein GL180_21050, partial [Vibrio toranzoniae]|nr:hypothetical protein [Vibrio toranzoniae]